MKRAAIWLFLGVAAVLVGCAGERQGLVCEEMEYRLNTMTYSPDQRAYAEEELRVCREEEAQKKSEGAAQRQSIYDRFAASDSSKSKLTDSTNAGKDGEVSVTKALQDSSGVETTSIYDRYKSVEQPSDSAAVDTSAADAGSFQ
ncbi:hypothetical protein [Fibrobacter sp. UWB10]|jgi:hypothetical protein|uniref:hypothetical protein n=1 Tax=Fibrobacter sp. UWB10 TaxID=1896201 RepID=UPI0024034225|nr:hypothetical protein [Fibrobacter sp. UWB10]SMP52961.1 hypothetical protein SAMN05720465_2114 [Fibrobacter sp. UWB10]